MLLLPLLLLILSFVSQRLPPLSLLKLSLLLLSRPMLRSSVGRK